MTSVILLLLILAGHQDHNLACRWHSPARIAPAGEVCFGSSKMGVIYVARCKVNDKPYVGQTRGVMKSRRRAHEREAAKGSRFAFHCALCKYGFNNFEWKVVAREDDLDELNDAEQVYIKLLKAKVPNGYNLTDGGNNYERSEEHKRKVSVLLTGRKLSDETRQKMRKPKTEEAKRKMRKPKPEGFGDKVSRARKGKPSSLRGTRVSVESNRLRREAALAQWADPERRARIMAGGPGRPRKKKVVVI